MIEAGKVVVERWAGGEGRGCRDGGVGGGNFLLVSSTSLIWKMHGTSVRNKFICMAQRACCHTGAQDAPERQYSWTQQSSAWATEDVKRKSKSQYVRTFRQHLKNHIHHINTDHLTRCWPSWLWPGTQCPIKDNNPAISMVIKCRKDFNP